MRERQPITQCGELLHRVRHRDPIPRVETLQLSHGVHVELDKKRQAASSRNRHQTVITSMIYLWRCEGDATAPRC